MDRTIAPGKHQISPDMTVLDVVSKYEATVKVLKGYDAQAGECICCQSLFETLAVVAEKYSLNLETLLADLAAVSG